MRQLVIGLFLGLLVGSTGALAQSSMCGQSNPGATQNVGSSLGGTWSAKHHAGIVRVAGMTMAYPPVAAESITITQQADGSLFAVSVGMNEQMQLLPSTGLPWDFWDSLKDKYGVKPVLSDQDVSGIAGCVASELPRLTGTADFTIPDAGVMKLTLRLIVLNTNSMFGILQAEGVMQGNPFLSLRSVTFKR